MISWPALKARLTSQGKEGWRPGEHWTLLGPTGTGKTHAALTIASLSSYTLVVGTKRRDPLMESLPGLGYTRVRDLEEDVVWTHEGRPLKPRLLYWPQPSLDRKVTQEQRLRYQAREIKKALEWADRTGGWTVVIDELMWASNNLGLTRELESLYFQARTQGVSVIGAAQRPRQVPLLALNQSTFMLIWQTSDKQDIERLRELSAGFPREVIESSVRTLSRTRHEALFVDAKNQELARVVMPHSIPRVA